MIAVALIITGIIMFKTGFLTHLFIRTRAVTPVIFIDPYRTMDYKPANGLKKEFKMPQFQLGKAQKNFCYLVLSALCIIGAGMAFDCYLLGEPLRSVSILVDGIVVIFFLSLSVFCWET